MRGSQAFWLPSPAWTKSGSFGTAQLACQRFLICFWLAPDGLLPVATRFRLYARLCRGLSALLWFLRNQQQQRKWKRKGRWNASEEFTIHPCSRLLQISVPLLH